MNCRNRVGLFVSLGVAATSVVVPMAVGCANYASPIGPDPGETPRNGDAGRDASVRDASDAAQSVPAPPATDAATSDPPNEAPANAGTCINIDGTFSITCDLDRTCAVVAPRDPDDFGGDKSPRMQCESKKYKTERCGDFACGIGCVCENPEARACRCLDDHQAYEPGKPGKPKKPDDD